MVANLKNNPPLQQDDADIRAAFALWCGLSIHPTHDLASKRLFVMICAGRAKAPSAPVGEDLILKLEELLR